MVDATFDLALDSQARGESLRFALRRVAIYAFLGLFALIYLLPLFVVVANSFRELPEITRNGLIALPHSFSLEGLAEGLGALLRRRHLRRHQAQLLQFPLHDHSGDDRLDPRRRAQRLRPLEMALPGIGDAVRVHRARRFHAGPGRAPALGLHPRRAAALQFGLWPHSDPRASRACRSRRCSAAIITSTSPTT